MILNVATYVARPVDLKVRSPWKTAPALGLTVLAHVGIFYGLSQLVRDRAFVAINGDNETYFALTAPWSNPASIAPSQDQRMKRASVPDDVLVPIIAPEPIVVLPNVDWSVQREIAAISTADRYPQSQASGDLDSEDVVRHAPLDPRKVLFPTPNHKNGYSAQVGDGELVTWLDERCHVTNLPPLVPRLNEDAPNVICKHPEKLPRTDLFEHLRPRYLRPDDNQQQERK